MRTLVPVVTAVVTACARPAPTPPAAPPTSVVAPVDALNPPESPSPLGTDSGTPAAEVSTQVPEDPRISLLRALASGAARVADHVDPARGILVVEYVEAGPGPGARAVRRAERLCGESVSRDTTLPGLFRAAMDQARDFELRCGDDGCTVQGMEYAPVWRVTFTGARITAVMRLTEAAVSDGYLAARDAFVRQRVEAQRSRPCPGGAR